MKNGDWVRLLSDEVGVMEGPSEEHGAGAFRNWPSGSIGEVLDFNEATGFATVIIPHDFGGPHSPFQTRVIVSSSDVEQVERRRLPDIELPDPPPDL